MCVCNNVSIHSSKQQRTENYFQGVMKKIKKDTASLGIGFQKHYNNPYIMNLSTTIQQYNNNHLLCYLQEEIKDRKGRQKEPIQLC